MLPAASLDHPRAVTMGGDPHAPCALPPLRAAGRRRYPNPIHSDTSRHETVAMPAGDSDTARRHWRKTPEPPWACVLGVTPCIQPAGERRLHDPTTQAPPPRRAETCGPGARMPERASPRAYHACAWARRHDASEPRAASPAPPRRGTGSAAPEVPSIGETSWPRGDLETASIRRSPSTRAGPFRSSHPAGRW